MADLSQAILNQVLEATLAFMILLLLLSVTAIIRVGPVTPASTEANTDTDMAPMPAMMASAPQPGRMVAAGPAPALWPDAGSNGMRPPPAPVRRSGWMGRARYEARHVRGRMPKPRPSAPAGPPWGPAAPPGRPQQGSERWT